MLKYTDTYVNSVMSHIHVDSIRIIRLVSICNAKFNQIHSQILAHWTALTEYLTGKMSTVFAKLCFINTNNSEKRYYEVHMRRPNLHTLCDTRWMSVVIQNTESGATRLVYASNLQCFLGFWELLGFRSTYCDWINHWTASPHTLCKHNRHKPGGDTVAVVFMRHTMWIPEMGQPGRECRAS